MAEKIGHQIIVGVAVGLILMAISGYWRKRQQVAPPVADSGDSWYSKLLG